MMIGDVGVVFYAARHEVCEPPTSSVLMKRRLPSTPVIRNCAPERGAFLA
ncbi:hypothetical protein ABIA38_007691 [Embleya sp. AB8]